MHLTFCSLIEDKAAYPAFAVMAAIHSSVERKIYAAIAAGKYNDDEFKRAFCDKHDMTSRQFNSMSTEVKGKISGTVESLKDNIEKTKTQSKLLARYVKELEKTLSTGLDKKGRKIGNGKKTRYALSIHEKKRKIGRCSDRITDMENRIAAPTPGICFGTIKLFNDQFKPKTVHKKWLKLWHEARDSQFFLVGAADEMTGCASCQSVVEADGTITLRLRPFNSMLVSRPVTGLAEEKLTRRKTTTAKSSDFIELRGVTFHHDATIIHEAINRNQGPNTKDRIKRSPLTWRFVRQHGMWYVHLSLDVKDKSVFDGSKGAIGIDCNQDHIAATAVDQNGNFVACRRFDLVVYGASSGHAKDMIGCVAKDVVAWATKLGSPIVAEDLDFQNKKRSMESFSGKRKRQLSSFHYAAWGQALRSRCLRYGVAFKTVDPSNTSLIGRVKYSASMGLSIHHAAALVIARRGLCLPENVPCSAIRVADGKGHYVTLHPPVRMGGLPEKADSRHDWCSDWRGMTKVVNAALAAHLSEARTRRGRASTMKSRSAAGMAKPWGIDDEIPSRSPVFRSQVGTT